MRWLALFPLLLSLACAGSPLRISSVERLGQPPYENSERLYRVAGDGWEDLKVGGNLDLRRPGDRRSLGRLEVVSVGRGFVMARVAAPGDTYPLVGDLAVSRDIRPQPLPDWPEFDPNPLPTLVRLAPSAPKADLRLQEPIFFLKGDGSLSPGGAKKLENWVQAYGRDGHWFLLCPTDPRVSPELVQARCQTLRTRLEQLGISTLEIRTGPFETHEKYDFVRVGREP
ncbi:MAG: hypothetical protein H6Q00_1244 [Holophagaceae bacterium]|nr:hypothetical protein [Holophagaceae bacterium]